jgi:phage shock protein PspC (stress-responsive transcriptional regulator)
MDMDSPHQPLARATRGRWVGGVCEGIARVRPIPVATLRAGFVLTTAFAGLGALVYLACWLIIPAEGEADAAARGAAGGVAPRAITSVILGCAAIAGLCTLAVLAASATVFGFGWIVCVVAGAILLGALASWSRLGPAWALLPVGALVLPSIAIAAAGVHVAPQLGDRTFTPETFADIPHRGYESGIGQMVIDLRHTQLPWGDDTIHVHGGLRRTIVALPHDRCVAVDVDYRVKPFALRAANRLIGEADPYESLTVFGRQFFARAGRVTWPETDVRARTTLHIAFDSSGGSLFVRDYADSVDVSSEPEWPGFANAVEPRPITEGLSRTEAAQELADWRVRVKGERRAAAHARRLMGGPCVTPKTAKGQSR